MHASRDWRFDKTVRINRHIEYERFNEDNTKFSLYRYQSSSNHDLYEKSRLRVRDVFNPRATVSSTNLQHLIVKEKVREPEMTVSLPKIRGKSKEPRLTAKAAAQRVVMEFTKASKVVEAMNSRPKYTVNIDKVVGGALSPQPCRRGSTFDMPGNLDPTSIELTGNSSSRRSSRTKLDPGDSSRRSSLRAHLEPAHSCRRSSFRANLEPANNETDTSLPPVPTAPAPPSETEASPLERYLAGAKPSRPTSVALGAVSEDRPLSQERAVTTANFNPTDLSPTMGPNVDLEAAIRERTLTPVENYVLVTERRRSSLLPTPGSAKGPLNSAPGPPGVLGSVSAAPGSAMSNELDMNRPMSTTSLRGYSRNSQSRASPSKARKASAGEEEPTAMEIAAWSIED